MTERIPERGIKKVEVERYGTCCSLFHVKCGTLFLGALEATIAVIILITVSQQIMWKNEHSSMCSKNILRDCLIFQFQHFNITLIFDYIVIILMLCILFSILLLMCGIITDTSCLFIPHLAVQALFFLFSAGYFLLYAWSYFYGDLYTHSRPFQMQSLFERMWLAALLLLLAAFEVYLFNAVLKCSMYVSAIERNRRRRESEFERCSERVRLAKQNGLWRTTSWGGGFQQYKGQYDESKPKKQTKSKGFRVQWNFNQNVVVEDEETPLRPDRDVESAESSSPPLAVRHQPLKQQGSLGSNRSAGSVEEPANQPKAIKVEKPKRSREEVEEIHVFKKDARINLEHRRRSSESPKKDKHIPIATAPASAVTAGPTMPKQTSIKKTSSEDKATMGHRTSPSRNHHEPSKSSPESRKHELHRGSSTKKEHQERPLNPLKTAETKAPPTKQIPTTHESSTRRDSGNSRPPLRTYKSVDSDDNPTADKTSSARREHRPHESRRRSSIEVPMETTVTHHIRHKHSPEKKNEVVLKKVSIRTTPHQ